MPRRAWIPVLWLLLATTGRADEDGAGRDENARNQRWARPVIEYVRPAERSVRVHLRNPSATRFLVHLQPPLGGMFGLEPRRAAVREVELPVGLPDALGLVGRSGDPRQNRTLPCDTCALPGGDEMTVALLVERRTFEAGNRRFGSFVRRMRKSFEDLHAFLEDPTATTSGSILPRERVRTRFRIDRVEVYDREEGARPPLFDDHPDHDLVVACDEGGPLAGFWLPAYSIGHNFLNGGDDEDDDSSRRGLWSAWGEQALWHELLHFRGVPDSYIFQVPKAALPGRTEEGFPLPERFRRGIMNHPYQEPRVAALTTAILKAKEGVRRVGACEEPDHEHGHMWRWLPRRLRLRVTKDGAPLVGATFRWFRSQPMWGLGDPRRQGVPADAIPSGEGFEIGGDYLGRGEARAARSLWLLVEVEHAGEVRFGVIRLLELNEAWAAGRRAVHELPLRWSDLLGR